MIIFYNKQTGKISGFIIGRVHDKIHLGVWAVPIEKNNRLIVQWKPIKEYKNEKGETIGWDYAPDHSQAELMFELDQNPSDIYNYKVNIKTKELELLK